MTKLDILSVLSDDEVARVAAAEEREQTVEAGSEYLDLDHLDRGVQKAKRDIKGPVTSFLPRGAVRPETWKKIEALLAA